MSDVVDTAAERDEATADAREAVDTEMRGPGWVAVRVGNADFGLPIERVREVLHPPPMARVPMTPPAVRGVASVRGDVVPVVDLGRRLGLGEAPAEGGRLVVVTHEVTGEPIGLLVDEVRGLVERNAPELEAAPEEVVAGLPDGLVRAVVGAGQDRTVVILELDRVLEIAGAGETETEAGV